MVMAEFHDHLPPWWLEFVEVRMMMDKLMMKATKTKKMMTPAQEKKLMKMLNELEDLLTEAGGS